MANPDSVHLALVVSLQALEDLDDPLRGCGGSRVHQLPVSQDGDAGPRTGVDSHNDLLERVLAPDNLKGLGDGVFHRLAGNLRLELNHPEFPR